MSKPHSTVEISIVIPLYNESGNIERLAEEIVKALPPSEVDYELLLVDDGSADDTWSVIEEACNSTPHIQGIRLSRNFGHQNALLAGLSKARGKAVISMDGDMQHPPSYLPELIELWRQGNKVVSTKRTRTEHLGKFKTKTSEWFYKVFSWLSGVQIEEGSSDFRLIDRQVLTELLRFNDVNPFLRGAVKWLGFDKHTACLEYQVGQRHEGESSYNLKRMLNFANSAIVSFSTKPLLLGIWLGLATSAIAFTELIYIIVLWSLGETVPGWASTVGIIALLFGVLFILLGVIGLYLSRIHTALQQRPKFVIGNITQAIEPAEDSKTKQPKELTS